MANQGVAQGLVPAADLGASMSMSRASTPVFEMGSIRA
ncbi:hypothetical protein I551_8638 [Mycobacterium ulcerans str. Harvey]|uniref:Uncharacterized protein n=1 Tax=Mycobacterium ulcerans str. Harvey TaxID=1299332 RepID=A0ABN0RAF6_MYCUL|nr:hypothetical protein I551_8638 [Mycobacterium ulcerans str. Harvey]